MPRTRKVRQFDNKKSSGFLVPLQHTLGEEDPVSEDADEQKDPVPGKSSNSKKLKREKRRMKRMRDEKDEEDPGAAPALEQAPKKKRKDRHGAADRAVGLGNLATVTRHVGSSASSKVLENARERYDVEPCSFQNTSPLKRAI